jgi:ribonuclease-3
VGDYKSALQEHLQSVGAGQPKYVLTDQTGPDHRKNFRIEVRIADGARGSITLAEAAGSTKKLAQQEAARRALASLLARSQGHDASPAGSPVRKRSTTPAEELAP